MRGRVFGLVRRRLGLVVLTGVIGAGILMGGVRAEAIRLWLAERALRQERYEDALATLLPLSRAGNPRAVTLLARTRLRQGRPQHAVELLETHLETRREPDWLALLGEAYLALGRLPEAWASYQAFVAERPDDLDGLARYAALTHRLGNPAQALAPYERLEALEPSNAAWPHARGLIYLETDRYGPAAEAFQAALTRDPQNLDVRFALAEAHYLAGNLDESLRHLDACLTARPSDLRILLARAECLRGLGRSDEAQAALDAALAQAPDHARALRLRAELHLERRALDQAVPLLERARAIDPDDWRVRYHLSRAYDGLGRSEEAQAELEQMQRLQATMELR